MDIGYGSTSIVKLDPFDDQIVCKELFEPQSHEYQIHREISRILGGWGVARFLAGNKWKICMERVEGPSLKSMFRSLSEEQKASIVLQLFFILYSLRHLKFNHNDLILDNIILRPRSRDCPVIKIEKTVSIDQGNGSYLIKRFEYEHRDYDVQLIDFGLSRLTLPSGQALFNPMVRDRYYAQLDEVPYFESVDLCKIFGNPLIVPLNMKNTRGYQYFRNCHFNRRYQVVPPFPDFTFDQILNSDLFRVYELSSTLLNLDSKDYEG